MFAKLSIRQFSNVYDKIDVYVGENLLPIMLGFAFVEVVYTAFFEACSLR